MSKTTLERLKEIATKRAVPKQSSKDRFWTPQDGESIVRFLPAKNRENVFFKEFGEHWIDKKRYLCPKFTAGASCPICESVNSLYTAGDEESVAMARLYKARRQHYANVIVAGKEEEGPKVFKFGIKLANRVVDECVDEELDISDLDNGLDYRIIRKKQDGYPNYDSSKAAKQKDNRKLTVEQVSAWYAKAEDLHTWIDSQLQTYEELEKSFTGASSGEHVEKTEFNEDEFLKEMDERV